tara:strand:+ start:5569 stop:5826 length:258 start_codon:yes stop_codon:yes gene_type:complete
MEKGKTIRFIKHQDLKKDDRPTKKGVVIETYYWTTIDGFIVQNSSSFDEEEARIFYDKVCELNGEVKVETVLDTTTFHVKEEQKN